MGGGWGIEEEIGAWFVWVLIFALIFAFFKFSSFFANLSAKRKGLDPNSPEGVEVAWKNLKWIAPLLLILIYFVGIIGRGQGWWGE